MKARWPLLASAVVMLTGMALMAFWSAPLIQADGLEMFDMRSGGYSFEDARVYFAALSDAERDAYLGPQRIADTLFPLGLTGIMAFGIFYLLRYWSKTVALVLATVPVAYFAFDMLENATVAGMLRAGADGIEPQLVAQSSFYTEWKMTLVNVAFAILVLSLAARILARIVRK